MRRTRRVAEKERKAAKCRAGLETIEVRRDGVMDGWKRPLGADRGHLRGLQEGVEVE